MNSLKEQAYSVIKQRIMDATYPADTFIDEKLLAQELNSSRTPVREAIIALSQEGHLKILPKRGVLVCPFTYQDAVDIFQVRELIEPWLVLTYGGMLTREELLHEKELIIEEVASNFTESRILPGISVWHHPHSLIISKCTNQNILDILAKIEEQTGRIPNIPRYQNPSFTIKSPDTKGHVQFARDEYLRLWFS